MKLETVVIIAKTACYVTVGFSASFVSGVTQYGADETITRNGLMVILVLACGGAATQLLAFLSSSFKNYQEEQKTIKDTPPDVPAQPKL